MFRKIQYAFALGVCTASIVVGGTLGYFVFGPMGVSADAEEICYAPLEEYYVPCLTYEPAKPAYILTVSDGYIVVLGPDEELWETTPTPVNALPPEEQQRLEEGIRLYSEEALIRILEDYGS